MANGTSQAQARALTQDRAAAQNAQARVDAGVQAEDAAENIENVQRVVQVAAEAGAQLARADSEANAPSGEQSGAQAEIGSPIISPAQGAPVSPPTQGTGAQQQAQGAQLSMPATGQARGQRDELKAQRTQAKESAVSSGKAPKGAKPKGDGDKTQLESLGDPKLNDPWYLTLKEAVTSYVGWVETLWGSTTILGTVWGITGLIYLTAYEYIWFVKGGKKPFKILSGTSDKLPNPQIYDHIIFLATWIWVPIAIALVATMFVILYLMLKCGVISAAGSSVFGPAGAVYGIFGDAQCHALFGSLIF